MYRLILSILLFTSLNCVAGEYAKQANESPFLDGQLNPKYEGELTALGGTIVKHVIAQNNNVYLVDLKIEKIKPIWVTSFIKPQGKQQIELGDRVVFKGYISSSASLDPTGELFSLIKSEMLLMAIFVQNQGV